MKDPLDDPRVKRMGDEVRQHLAEISDLFKPGYRMTVLARNPDYPDGTRDVLVTDDEMPAIISAVQRRIAEEARSRSDVESLLGGLTDAELAMRGIV